MNHELPSGAEVRSLLLSLSYAQMQELSKASGVPFTTLWKVRSGMTGNPGIETVRKFLPLVPAIAN